MSVQFGKWNLDGRPVEPREFEPVRPVLAEYGPDAEGCFCENNVGIIYRAFYTTKESRMENQPHISSSGLVITWDGRLDNRENLLEELKPDVWTNSTDVSIVAAAYEHWGNDAFRRLIGDWALSVWHPKDQVLVLAKDFVGTRHLYYSVEDNQVAWSTVLNPLILCARHPLTLDEEYIAGWLALFPAPHLTPYVGIHSVPPSSMVHLRKGRRQISKYWDFNPSEEIRYRSDPEYEEHFRTVFADAVRRRLRSDTPVLAELSGGMDSSSIVCVADAILARKHTEASILETVSYYDNSEPNWDESPYFTLVEKQRGRSGCHIDASGLRALTFDSGNHSFAPIPGAAENAGMAPEQFAPHVASENIRVLLSGIGGDEVCGGVPTPIPELADLLARGRLGKLASSLCAWALSNEEPWFHLLLNTVKAFCPAATTRLPKFKRPAPWLSPTFVRRSRVVWEGNAVRLKMFGPLPSFQENLATLNQLQRQLAWSPLSSQPPYERRYPYLDRDLMTFLYAIPPEQLVRPGQRRSLARRALAGLVPVGVLNRKRKAFADRRPRAAVLALWASLRDRNPDLLSDSMEIVDARALARSIEELRRGLDAPTVLLMRTLTMESWLRNLNEGGLLDHLQHSHAAVGHRQAKRYGLEWETPRGLRAKNSTQTG